MNPEEQLQDALSNRAADVEPSADSYASLAERVTSATSPAPWWQSPRLYWLTAAGAGVAALVAIVVLGIFGTDNNGDVVATPATTPTLPAAPSATPEPTPPPTPTVAPLPAVPPTNAPEQPSVRPQVGPPEGVIWPTEATMPFGEWHNDPDTAAHGFVASLTGFDLPIGEITWLDPIDMVADVTLQSRGEDGEPFGEATVVRVVGGFDDIGNEQWGALWARSDMIQVDSWRFVGEPPEFEPQGRGWAFEGTIGVALLQETGGVVGDWFVMGGGVQLAPLTGTVPVGPTAAGPGYAVFTDLGGLGIAPTSLTIVGIELPEIAGDDGGSAPGQCSASGMNPPEVDAELPDAVAATRQAITEATIACDYEALEQLMSSAGFSYSFGDGGDAIGFWQQLEATGGDPLRFLTESLGLPYAIDDVGDEPLYVWPDVFLVPWEDVTEAQKEALRPLYGDADFTGWESFGGFIGYRVGISESGDWIFFIAGD